MSPYPKTAQTRVLRVPRILLLLLVLALGPSFGWAQVTEAANVKTFGAIGDGTTDDTRALQAALSSSSAHIYIPPGKYRLRAPLKIGSQKRLTLSPRTTILRAAEISTMIINDADGKTADFSANRGIIIEGGTWDGNATVHPSACTIIAIGHASDVVIRNCTIVNVPSWHGIEFNATRRSTISAVTIRNCPNEAIQLDTMNSGNPGVFPWFGPYNDQKCQDITIEDCSFTNISTAIGSHSAPAVETVAIKRCSVSGSTEPAIKPVFYVNMTLEDCSFFKCDVAFEGSAVGFVIRRNRIENSARADLNMRNCSNGIIEHNIISPSRSGIINLAANVIERSNTQVLNSQPPPPTIADRSSSDKFSYGFQGTSTTVIQATAGLSSAPIFASTGDILALRVAATNGTDFSYKWFKNGEEIAGETDEVLYFPTLSARDSAVFIARVISSAGISVTGSIDVRINVQNETGTALANVSIRCLVPDRESLVVGYVVTGQEKRLLLRAIGPSLSTFGITNSLRAPRIQPFDSLGQSTSQPVSGWSPSLASVFDNLGAFSLPPSSEDAAVLITQRAGAATFQVSGANSGVVLAELFDRDAATTSSIINFSARAVVSDGSSTLIAGFVLTGRGTKHILIRGVGPSLSLFGITNPLLAPRITIFRRDQKIAENTAADPALSSVYRLIGAFPLSSGRDTAILITAQGGENYTAVLNGQPNESGIALLEVYQLPD